MKTLDALPFWVLAALLLAVSVMFNSGCASTPKPDWNERIGNYTYDDAVRELGPPASTTKLQDGTAVAEWFLKYGSQMSFGLSTGMYGPGGGIGVGQTISPPPKAHFLRLTFGTDGKLQRWEKIQR